MLLAASLTEQVIGLAIEVHPNTGPGLLEVVDEHCWCVAARRRNPRPGNPAGTFYSTSSSASRFNCLKLRTLNGNMAR